MHNRQPVRLSECKVINTVRRRRVNDTGTALGANEISCINLERGVGIHLEIVEQALIASTKQFAAFDGLDDGMFQVAHDRLAQRFCNDQRLAVDFAVAVVDVGAHGECEV